MSHNKGLIVTVFYNPQYRGCGGDTSKAEEVLLVGNGIAEIFEANGRPLVVLKQGAYPGTCIAVPVDQPVGACGPMMGGSFLYSSDGRFGEAVNKITKTEFYGAIPLHDRFEF